MKEPTTSNVFDWVDYAHSLKRTIFRLEQELRISKRLNYDCDEDGNILSCCGDIVDEDIMICPTCKEHQ